jgi:16S rRNA (guanine527-N7)-methyltransferase
MRSELPAPPPEAARVFGPRLELAERYAALLVGPGTERGLLGPREASRLWPRHLLNCAVLAPHIPPGASVCDLGSGAGLPGLVIAILRPDVRMTLLEPLLRRSVFLGEAVTSLGLPHVQVRRGRAEDVAGSLTVDVVAARAVAPLERLVSWSMPLLRPGGVLLALKGAAAAEEAAVVRASMQSRGVASVDVLAESPPGAPRQPGEGTWIVAVCARQPRPAPAGSGAGSGAGTDRLGRRAATGRGSDRAPRAGKGTAAPSADCGSGSA